MNNKQIIEKLNEVLHFMQDDYNNVRVSETYLGKTRIISFDLVESVGKCVTCHELLRLAENGFNLFSISMVNTNLTNHKAFETMTLRVMLTYKEVKQ